MSIRSFLKLLRDKKQLHIINLETSKEYETANIAYRLNKPILFKNVNGFKVAINLLNSRDILSLLFNVPKIELTIFLSSCLKKLNGSTIIKGPLKLDNLIEKNIDLKLFPILKFFPGDGGNGYITSGIVICEFNGVFNASIHRLMVIGSNKLGIRIVPTRHTDFLYQSAVSQKKKLPISIVIGSDPIITYACSTRVPISKEFIYASTLKN